MRLIDFDQITRDPAHPERLLPAFDSGDHLHPSPAGYAAMAQSIPLSLFVPPAGQAIGRVKLAGFPLGLRKTEKDRSGSHWVVYIHGGRDRIENPDKSGGKIAGLIQVL